MSKSKDVLIDALRKNVGAEADPARVVDELFRLGALDHVRCRQVAVRVVFPERYAASDKSAREVMGDIGEEFGLTRAAVWKTIAASGY